MTFNSIVYFLFLPAVYVIFFYTGERWRWAVLLAASAYFYYALDVQYLLPVLLLTSGINYVAGILLSIPKLNGKRKTVLWSGIAVNLLILVSLKYISFLTNSLKTIFSALSWNISIYTNETLLSIGVSFYIFQAISYLIDIYRKKENPERHFGYFVLYLSFFPKLLQGPIERAGSLLPQLRARYIFDYENMRAGLLMILGGLFKKLVLADRLALYVNPVYDNVNSYSGTIFVIATYLYALQLYFDFSGYTDIALGSARMFNIKLTQNFNSPYQSTSIADFWRRWHISLSTWLRDYLYIPLGGNRAGSFRRCYNLLIVFLLCGLWHGASWSFIVWGLMHGIYLITSVLYTSIRRTLYNRIGLKSSFIIMIWQWFLTFNLVSFAWIFFRANTLSDAWYIVTHLFSGTMGACTLLVSQGKGEMVVTILSLLAMVALWSLKKKVDILSYLFAKPLWFRWTCYYGMTMSILIFGVFFSEKTFIYFKF
jgi:D-alanyl-lipoteichoic acid acyltransferase DltB (MBOAT superfamily)